MTSAFTKYRPQAWPYRFEGSLHIGRVCGGIPTDPKVAEGWLRTKLGAQTDDVVRQQVAEVMAERGEFTPEAEEAAIAEVDANRHLNGFKRDAVGLYIEGRQLKAAIKEATSIAYAAGKLLNKGKNSWGTTNKGIHSFIAEHVCVVEDKLHLGVTEPSGVAQRFVHTFRGTGIQYEEYVDDAKVDFTVISDHEFTDEQWAMIWLTGEQQGVEATRSQGYGRYTVTRWDRIS